MIEHAKRDRRPSWVPWMVILFAGWALVICVAVSAGKQHVPHAHPAADGIVTRAEIEAMLVQANREHAKQRALIEAVHVRVDRLVEGVKALAPELPGTARANVLIEEAGR